MIKHLELHQLPHKHHQWTGNDEFGHYHACVPASETPYFLHLSWRKNRGAEVHSVGYYELDLAALLAEDYIREDGAGYVRVRFVHAEDGNIYIQIRQNAPRLYVGILQNRTDKYRSIVRRVFQEVAGDTPSTDDLRIELICDDVTGHYQLSEVGWDEDKRRDDVILHADIIDGKVWIQSDETNLTLTDLLLDAGIQREHIVLAFHPPHLRQYTDYAAA